MRLVESARVRPLYGVAHGWIDRVHIWLERHRLCRRASVPTASQACIVQELGVPLYIRQVPRPIQPLAGVELLEEMTSLTGLDRGGQLEGCVSRFVLRKVFGHGVL